MFASGWKDKAATHSEILLQSFIGPGDDEVSPVTRIKSNIRQRELVAAFDPFTFRVGGEEIRAEAQGDLTDPTMVPRTGTELQARREFPVVVRFRETDRGIGVPLNHSVKDTGLPKIVGIVDA